MQEKKIIEKPATGWSVSLATVDKLLGVWSLAQSVVYNF